MLNECCDQTGKSGESDANFRDGKKRIFWGHLFAPMAARSRVAIYSATAQDVRPALAIARSSKITLRAFANCQEFPCNGRLTAMIHEFGPSLYVADGPTVSFFGFPYPTRMAVARLSDGGCWVWSPVELTDELFESVQALGPLRYIVSPNKLHYLFLAQWSKRWPEARLYAPPGLAAKKPDLRFDAMLSDEPDSAWSNEIDQVIFRGSLAMEEVVFFHRKSRTAIFCDLIQRFPEAAAKGWKGMLMKVDGLVGEHGSTPREWRATFVRRGQARTARAEVLSWKPQRLLIAHGECAQTGASAIIQQALDWI